MTKTWVALVIFESVITSVLFFPNPTPEVESTLTFEVPSRSQPHADTHMF